MKKNILSNGTKKPLKKAKGWLDWLFISLIIILGNASYAQINAYSFTQSQGVYQSIISDGQLVPDSEATAIEPYNTSGWDITLPFDFNFNFTNYNSIYVNSNGGATFGTYTSTGVNLISSGLSYSGAIGVMNRDLWGNFLYIWIYNKRIKCNHECSIISRYCCR